MGPKTTPSLISKGGYLGGREIDTPWKIGLKDPKGPKHHIQSWLKHFGEARKNIPSDVRLL